MSKIIRLDELTKNKIAAGEVVERPVSVVKEMLENSLDANATEIEIDILDGGVKLIRIRDNGDGIEKNDIPLVFERYATSKIKTFNDLFSLSSFGFRGEALASIATISQIDLETATKNDSKTTTYHIDHSESGYKAEKPYQKGTTIAINYLFYNVPVRKKFLSSINKEFSLIHDLVLKYSLAFPEVDFILKHQNELIYTTRGYKTTEDIFLKNYGLELSNKLIVLKNIKLSNNVIANAWLVQESFTKNTKAHEIFFINGRLIKSRLLENAIDEAYYTLIAKGRFPIVLLSFSIPSDHLDVNIHPSKKEIKIFGFENWREELIEYLKENLWQASLPQEYVYNTNIETKNFNLDANDTQFTENAENLSENTGHFVANEEKIVYETPKVIQQDFNYDFNHNNHNSTSINTTENSVNKPVLLQNNEELKKIPLPDIEIIGQLNYTFILGQDRENLYIIDQHTCHERILYERLMNKENRKDIFIQPLLIPEKIQLTPIQEETLTSHILDLRTLGFIIEKNNEDWYLNAIPKCLFLEKDFQTYLSDLLDVLINHPNIDYATLVEEILTTASCKGAVKANWKLSMDDMTYLLAELKETKNPHTCPHGRPIIIKLSMQELYMKFDRGYFTPKLR